VVSVKYDAEGICGITTTGHSGFAEKGSDIVCAAISVLMQALSVGLKYVIRIEGVKEIIDPQIPLMGFEWDSRVAEGQIIGRMIAMSLEGVANSYPDNVKYNEIREILQEDGQL
jgi:uncharacterized protein YsxB (DUF464 family)